MWNVFSHLWELEGSKTKCNNNQGHERKRGTPREVEEERKQRGRRG
jgi:hypothetical protein